MMNKTIRTIAIFALSMSTLVSCSDFLEPYPNGDISDDFLWQKQEMVQGLINQAYVDLPNLYNNNEGVYMDGATDDAVITSTTHNIRKLAVGALTPGSDPFSTYWERNYSAIFQVNTFLEDDKGYNTRLIISDKWDLMVRNRLKGEAFALRAWFQWDLLQKFGGLSVDGDLLGFPIVTTTVDLDSEINFERNTYDECVEQIIADLDSAYAYLPIAHRDFLVENSADLLYAGSRFWGRMDGITTRAIKSLVYLTWASPAFNPDNDMSRWDMAAKYAKEVMDFKRDIDGTVSGGFNPTRGVNWTDPNFPGFIWAKSRANNDVMERMFYPNGFNGNGQIGATQELVDAFPMSNGYPKDHPMGAELYDPQNPYLNRDNRFYSTIFHNGDTLKRLGTGEDMYVFENWGKDAAEVNSNNSRTNYHIKKFLYLGTNWNDASVDQQPRSRSFIRWAHMVLAFAEAANHVVGPDVELYGMSAKEAIGLLRKRNTSNQLAGFSEDPYLDEVAAQGSGAFDTFIKNERRIETSFEGIRYYDLRRWNTPLAELNKPVHKVDVKKNEDGSFTYSVVQVENRNFSSLFNPIPYVEILRMSNLQQNEGWELWN